MQINSPICQIADIHGAHVPDRRLLFQKLLQQQDARQLEGRGLFLLLPLQVRRRPQVCNTMIHDTQGTLTFRIQQTETHIQGNQSCLLLAFVDMKLKLHVSTELPAYNDTGYSDTVRSSLLTVTLF